MFLNAKELGLGTHACNLSAQEAEEEGSRA